MINIKHLGYLNKKGRFYIIEVDGVEKQFMVSDLENLLKEHGLTLQDYYNMSVYGDFDHKVLCLKCGKPTTLKYQMHRGYNKFCNQSCSTSYRNLYVFNPSKTEEVRRKASERQSKILKELSSKGLNPFQDKDFISRNAKKSSERMRILVEKGEHLWQTEKHKKEHSERLTARNLRLSREGKHNFQNADSLRKSLIARYEKLGITHTHLYLILQDKDYVKIGTSYKLRKRRNEIGNSYGRVGEIHDIMFGDIYLIAELEALVKEKFCKVGSEIFEYSKLKDVLNEIRLFKINNVQRLSKS